MIQARMRDLLMVAPLQLQRAARGWCCLSFCSSGDQNIISIPTTDQAEWGLSVYPSIHASIHPSSSDQLFSFFIHPHICFSERAAIYAFFWRNIWLRHRRSTCGTYNISISIGTLDVAFMKAKQLYLITVCQQHNWFRQKNVELTGGFCSHPGLMQPVDQPTMEGIFPHAHASGGRHS